MSECECLCGNAVSVFTQSFLRQCNCNSRVQGRPVRSTRVPHVWPHSCSCSRDRRHSCVSESLSGSAGSLFRRIQQPWWLATGWIRTFSRERTCKANAMETRHVATTSAYSSAESSSTLSAELPEKRTLWERRAQQSHLMLQQPLPHAHLPREGCFDCSWPTRRD